MGRRHLLIVPHTHWDREWYRTHEQFRYRLVRVLDGLLELLEKDPGFAHFTLDGQTIVVDDYLEVRPGARERIVRLVRAGRLLIGPWYVLPDEWLVSGEALVRNLQRGLARAEALGGGMALGYVPDQFGHVGQLPQIFRGLGFDAAVLWRGVGADVEGPLFRWEAPDGTRLFTVYLARGYGNAVNLPLEPEALAARLLGEIRAQDRRARRDHLLLMNGSDHEAPQAGLPRALRAAAPRLPDVELEIGTLPGFVERARREMPEPAALHRGELRSGLRAPLLEGCASARIPQKRADFLNDRLLTRYVEPLAAWLGALGGDADPGMIDHAWRMALENHPHDSICGCSIDAVHEQMEARFARVREVAEEHLARVTRDLGARVAAPGEVLVAWNPGAAGVARAEGEVELDAPGRRPRLHLIAADGRRIALRAERSAAGAVLAEFALPAPTIARIARGFPPEFMGLHAAALRWRRRAGGLAVELELGDAPPPGFDLAAAKAELLRALEAEGEREARFRARRRPRFRVAFADALPGCGIRVYRVARGTAGPGDPSLRAEALAGGGARIENGCWRVEIDGRGRVVLDHRPSGARVDDALRIVSEGDRGDEYNFDPVPGDASAGWPPRARVRLAPAAEGEVGIDLALALRIPAGLGADRSARARRRVALPVAVRLTLTAGLDRLDLGVDVRNTARDHRLRLCLRAPFAARAFEVESAFEVVRRPIEPDPGDFGSERPAERPIGATPQRGFATLVGDALAATLANRGSPEIEALREPDGTTSLAVTLLRAVGWLSRDDLLLRPGHAGPPLETPSAQGLGRHRAELSLRWHPPAEAERAARAGHFRDAPLVFAAGAAEGELADGSRLLEVDDPAVAVSAIEPRAEGGTRIRLVNLSDEPRRARVRFTGTPGRGLEVVDLRGRPSGDPELAADPDAGARVRLRPWQIATLRVV